MTDNKQTGQSGLTEEFQAAHSALVLDASFANTKVAIGRVFVLENNRIEPSEDDRKKRYGLSPETEGGADNDVPEAAKAQFVEEQTERYNDARDRTIVTYENYLADAQHALIEVRDIALDSLGAELALVRDSSLAKKVHARIQDGTSAEVAADDEYEKVIAKFRSMDAPSIKKVAVELDQHRATLQHHLHPDKKLATLSNIQPGTLLVSPTFPLSALSSFRDHETSKNLVDGAITDAGSLESHGAILITGMGIPYARIAAEDMARMKNDDIAIMDGAKGQILLHPNKTVIESYEVQVNAQQDQSEALLHKSEKRKSVATTDGVKVNVHANFSVSHEAHDLKIANPVGIGLYRTEIAASMRENSINSNVWQSIFKQNMAACDPKGSGYIGTIIRTIDLAGDKSELPKAEREQIQSDMTQVQMHALALVQKDMAEQGHKSKLKVMVPMISSNEDMKAMQAMMDEQAQKADAKSIKLGCMVEVPALITELDKLDTAFMSVGSNDLIHSILGIDRYDSESIKKYDPTNPAVLKALDEVTSVGAERDIPVSICGNMASDPRYTALLIGAGYTNMSAKIDSIPIVKEVASRVNMEEARQLFDTIKDTDTRAGREELLRDFNSYLGLSADGHIDLEWKAPDDAWTPSAREIDG